MSRHLAFWKYDEGVYLDNQEVYENVCIEENRVEGLSALPVAEIRSRVNEVFGDYDQLDESVYVGEQGDFTILTTEQSVLFDCGFAMPEEDLNKIIDIMLEFDCPLYDPQISARFDGM